MKPEKRLLAILGATLMVMIIAISIFLYPKVAQPETAIAKSEEKKVEPKPTEQKVEEIVPTEEAVATSTPKPTTTPKVTQTSTPTPTAVPTNTKYVPFPNPKDSNERYSNLVCETFSTEDECTTALQLVWLAHRDGTLNPNKQSVVHFGLFYLVCPHEYVYNTKEACEKMLDPVVSIQKAYIIYKTYGFQTVRALQEMANNL